jgi:hypothetical protein
LSSVYDVKLVNKNKGFFIIVAKIRWHVDKNSLEL